MTGHDRRKELNDLLEVAWEAINQAKPGDLSALLNTANRLSKDLHDLEHPAEAQGGPKPTTDGDGASAVAIFQQRMRKRDRRAS